jgi:hypothetical protein
MQWLGIASACLTLWICWQSSDSGGGATTAASGSVGPVLAPAPGVSPQEPDMLPLASETRLRRAMATGVSSGHEATASSLRRWLDSQPEQLNPARLAEGCSLLEGRR